MKQTAVEWLEEELKANLKKVILEGDSELMESLFEQAKEMEKEQLLHFAKLYDDDLSEGKIRSREELYKATFNTKEK